MPLIEVMLEVAPRIALGLASGQLERVGGVVREAGSKQVVMWLREGGLIESNPDLAGGLLKAVLQASSGGMVSTFTGAANLAATARSHYMIMQGLGALTNLVGVVGGIGVLNLAATTVSTTILLKRLSELERGIEGLYEHISREFSADRQVKLEAAIHAATDALNMDGPLNRNLQANSAIDKLFAARQHIWREVDALKGSSGDSANNQLMQNNILQAMQLDSLRSRCLLEINELPRAKAYLVDKLESYRETSRLLVHRLLGEHRAVYFHKSVQESDLFRYLAIEFWLHAKGDRLLEILLANRHDFWNQEVADESKIAKPGKARRVHLPNRSKGESEDHPHIDALTQSELLIENYQRFQGIQAEIEAIERLGITHSEWEKQVDEALSIADVKLEDYNDYVLLIDQEFLDSAKRQEQMPSPQI